MKNLYKIEDELYIVSDTESVSENSWIITSNRLVQVSYLLSDEVAKRFKVILTTNKLLIKDGVQSIPDEFLEWFVKNPSCEEIEFKMNQGRYFDYGGNVHITNAYKIIIPKEEPKQETLEYDLLQHIKFCLECNNESQAIRLIEKYGFQKQEEMYSKEDMKSFVDLCRNQLLNTEFYRLNQHLEQFKQIKNK